MIYNYNNSYNYTDIIFMRSQAVSTALYIRFSASVRAAVAFNTIFNMHTCVLMFFHFVEYNFLQVDLGAP